MFIICVSFWFIICKLFSFVIIFLFSFVSIVKSILKKLIDHERRWEISSNRTISKYKSFAYFDSTAITSPIRPPPYKVKEESSYTKLSESDDLNESYSDVSVKMYLNDVFWINKDPIYHRKLSCIIQLTDPNEYEGGEFELIDTTIQVVSCTVHSLILSSALSFLPDFMS